MIRVRVKLKDTNELVEVQQEVTPNFTLKIGQEVVITPGKHARQCLARLTDMNHAAAPAPPPRGLLIKSAGLLTAVSPPAHGSFGTPSLPPHCWPPCFSFPYSQERHGP